MACLKASEEVTLEGQELIGEDLSWVPIIRDTGKKEINNFSNKLNCFFCEGKNLRLWCGHFLLSFNHFEIALSRAHDVEKEAKRWMQ